MKKTKKIEELKRKRLVKKIDISLIKKEIIFYQKLQKYIEVLTK